MKISLDKIKPIWVAISLAVGSISTGVAYLLGEGSARATYASRFDDHERRIGALEERAKVAQEQNSQIIGMLGELKGEMRAVRLLITNGDR